ncbi:unnamed protein product [Hymenolepis diminuta]|uniref:RRM domain-containing protein n=1 Tax=Hymenolepis diminuta TaxID=6216 RepID=A0A564YCJ3_HYMDI|nr:unnamed protein product [Hymenolepis diminuta]
MGDKPIDWKLTVSGVPRNYSFASLRRIFRQLGEVEKLLVFPDPLTDTNQVSVYYRDTSLCTCSVPSHPKLF